jgi:hypothetical protein
MGKHPVGVLEILHMMIPDRPPFLSNACRQSGPVIRHMDKKLGRSNKIED